MKAMPPETDGLFGLIPEMYVLRMQLTCTTPPTVTYTAFNPYWAQRCSNGLRGQIKAVARGGTSPKRASRERPAARERRVGT